MKLSEALALNQSIAGQLSKIETEISTGFNVLQDAIVVLQNELADATLTHEQAQSFVAVQDAVNQLDRIVPDPVLPVDPTDPVITV